jgi:hypothetical protein
MKCDIESVLLKALRLLANKAVKWESGTNNSLKLSLKWVKLQQKLDLLTATQLFAALVSALSWDLGRLRADCGPP